MAEKRVDLVLNVSANGAGAAGGLGQLDARLASLQATIDKLGGAVAAAGEQTKQSTGKLEAELGKTREWSIKGAATSAVGKAAVGGAALSAAVQMSDAVDKLGYSFLSSREKAVAFTNAIPLVGSALSSLVTTTLDAIDRLRNPEAAKALARDELFMGREANRVGALGDYERKVYGVRQQDLTAGYSARALAELPTLASERARFAGNSAGVMANRYGAPYAAGAATGPLGAALFGAAAVGGAGAMGSKFGEKGIDDRLAAAMEGLRTAQRAERAAQLGADASQTDRDESRRRLDDTVGAWRARAESTRRMTDDYFSDGTVTLRELPPGAPVPAGGPRGDDYSRNDFGRARRAGMSVAGGAAAYLGGLGYDIVNKAQNLFTDAPNRLDPMRKAADEAAAPGGATKLTTLSEMNKETMALLRAQQAMLDFEQKSALNKERQLELLKKQHEVAKATTEVMRAQLSIITDELGKTKAGARQFGAMDDFNKEGLTAAYQRFKEGGRSAVSAGELALLQGNALTAEEVNKKLEKDTANDPKFKEFLKAVGGRDVATIEAEQKKLKAEIDLKVQVDEEKFAKLMQEKLKDLNIKDILGDIIKTQFEMKLREFAAGADRARIERS